MKDFNGVELEVGDTVAYIRKGYRSFVRGKVEKIHDVMVSVDKTIRSPSDVIIVKKVVKEVQKD